MPTIEPKSPISNASTTTAAVTCRRIVDARESGSPYTGLDEGEIDLQQYDVVAIVTDHSAFPYPLIAKHAKVIVDTRNALKHVPHDRSKVMLLGGGDF